MNALSTALDLENEHKAKCKEVYTLAIREFFTRFPDIEEVTFQVQLLQEVYTYKFELVKNQCKVRRRGYLIPIPLQGIQDNQLYEGVGELLLTLSLLKGALREGTQTLCRLNHID